MDLSNENVIHVEKEGIQYLQFRKLLKYSDIITHGYSLGIEKNFRTARANKQKLPEQEAKKAIKDYENLGKCIDIKLNKMVKPNQAHTDKIQIVEKQKDKEKWNIDTVLINKILLKQEGLKQENIIDSGICSVCNSDLIHSYRVERQGYGLATALIKINDKVL